MGHHIGKGIQRGKNDEVSQDRVKEIQGLDISEMSIDEMIALSEPDRGKKKKQKRNGIEHHNRTEFSG